MRVLGPGQRSAPVIAFVVAMPTIMAWVMGYLNERRAGGSILPGWVLHGAGNTVAYITPLLAGI